MVGAWQEKDIPRLNSAAELPRRRRDKGDKMPERSSTVALNGVDSLSALDLLLFFSFRWVLDVWVFFFFFFLMFVFESHVSLIPLKCFNV